MTTEDLDQLERKFGIRLPAEYRLAIVGRLVMPGYTIVTSLDDLIQLNPIG